MLGSVASPVGQGRSTVRRSRGKDTLQAPRPQKHDLLEAVGRIGPEAPGRAAGRIILLLLGEGGVDRHAHKIHIRELALLAGNILLPILAFDDAALTWDWCLLVLRG